MLWSKFIFSNTIVDFKVDCITFLCILIWGCPLIKVKGRKRLADVEILVVRYCLRFCNFSIKLGTNVAAVYAHILLASQKGQGSQEVVKCVKNTCRKKTWISLVQKWTLYLEHHFNEQFERAYGQINYVNQSCTWAIRALLLFYFFK